MRSRARSAWWACIAVAVAGAVPVAPALAVAALELDHGGRLLGEDYVECAQGQAQGDDEDVEVGSSAIALGRVGGGGHAVDVRHYYDALPPWEGSLLQGSVTRPGGSGTYDAGRLVGTSDRAQRSIYAYDARRQLVWSGRQAAVIPLEAAVPATLGDPPQVFTGDAVAASTREYDERESRTYVVTRSYEHGGRPDQVYLPADPDFGGTAPVVRKRAKWTQRDQLVTSYVYVCRASRWLVIPRRAAPGVRARRIA